MKIGLGILLAVTVAVLFGFAGVDGPGPAWGGEGQAQSAASRPATAPAGSFELRAGNRHLRVEITQGQQSWTRLPADPNGLVLTPAPFSIRLGGDANAASFVCVRDANFLLPLHRVRVPLVSFAGLGGAWDRKDMFLQDESLDVQRGDSGFFRKEWGVEANVASQYASDLARKAGQVPAVLMSAKMYLGNDQVVTIESFGDKPGDGGRIVLVIFLQEDLGLRLGNIPFWRNVWMEVPILFSQSAAPAATQPGGS